MSMTAAASAHVATGGPISVRALQPTIGAEIEGVDLSRPLSPEQRDAIRAAVLRHKVIFFRDQTLTNEQQAEFAANFGPLYTHPSSKRDDKVAPIHRIAAVDAANMRRPSIAMSCPAMPITATPVGGWCRRGGRCCAP
jgi:alpha-ketoglutarate-dependent taurine dioxygenase